jgi:hypothetical protein
MSDLGESDVLTRGSAVLERVTASTPYADRIPNAVLMHFALALPAELKHVPYLDATIEMDGAPPRTEFVGELVALTDAGVLVELSYRGGDEINPVRLRPLRGRVAEIGVAYDEQTLDRGRLPARSVTITLDNDSAVTLPLTRRADGVPVLGAILAALTD